MPALLARACSVWRLLIDASCPLGAVGFGSMGSSHDQQVRSADEEAGLNDAGDLIERQFKFPRLIDPRQMNIHDKITRLGDERSTAAFSKDHPAGGEGSDVSRRTAPAERNHFDRKRKRPPEHRDLFRVIHHYNELFG